MSMSRRRACAVALCAALTGVGCRASAAEPPLAASAPEPSGTLGENMVTATATVKKLDLKTRMVTLQRADGSMITFRAHENVRNLPQVRVGDEVTATYYESLAYSVKRPGEAVVGATVDEEFARAAKGQKPGAAGGRVITVTTKIEAIDKAAGTVTMRGPDGETSTVKVRDPKHLDPVAVGDLVEIKLTEAVAISVTAPAR